MDDTILSKRARYIAHALACYLAPGQVSELRVLGVQGRRAICQFFDDPPAMAAAALDYEAQGAIGVYFTPNPLSPSVIEREGDSRGASKADVLSRRWLLVDVDSVRPAGQSATADEKTAAWEVADRVMGELQMQGVLGEILSDSANGWHVAVPIHLPNDDASQEFCKAVLAGLSKVCSTEHAVVDGKTFDAPRIWKMPGLLARKGEHTDLRPHRYASIVRRDRERPWSEELGTANVQAMQRMMNAWRRYEQCRDESERSSNGNGNGSGNKPRMDAITRARAYLRKEPPAVSGAGGHDRAFHVSMILTEGFGLISWEAFQEGISEWNATCAPPWSEKELRHKYESACKRADPVRMGHLLREGADGYGDAWEGPEFNGHAKNGHESAWEGAGNSKQEQAKKAPPQGFSSPIPASALKISESAEWLWHGYLSPSNITLFSALWKSGKTTLLAHLLRSMETGGDFCGRKIAAGRALVVSEESETRWAKRCAAIGLRDHIEFIVQPFSSKPSWEMWAAFLKHLYTVTNQHRYDLIVMDPLVNLWPVRDENDASQVISALLPLRKLPGNAAQLLIHHSRKGDGTEATASRGSGGLTGFVDTIMELRRYDANDKNDRRRVITAYGRDDETPHEIVVELTEGGYQSSGGSRRDVSVQGIMISLMNLLPAEEPGMTAAEILDSWPEGPKPQRNDLFPALHRGVDEGRWTKSGDGKKGNPYRFWSPRG